MSTAQVRIQATGKRKTSVARVTLTPGTGTVTCNGRPAEQYFDRAPLRAMALSPLVEVGLAHESYAC